MANELSMLSGNLPTHLRGQLDETTKALMGHVSDKTNTSKRISIKGGVFRMVVGGKEVAQNEERSMNIVVVAAAPHNSRTFYAKTFSEGQGAVPPDCSSENGISPSEKSTNPQAKSCKDCPQNIDGSHSSGKGRACRFSRRLAVLLENDQQGDVYQMTLPASSIFGKPDGGKMPLEAYVKLLGTNGVSVTSVVTEMKFDLGGTAPKLTFKAVRYLEADEFANAQAKGKTPEAKAAIGASAGELDKGVMLEAPAVKEESVVVEEVAEPVKRPTKKEAVEAPKDINSVLDDWT